MKKAVVISTTLLVTVGAIAFFTLHYGVYPRPLPPPATKQGLLRELRGVSIRTFMHPDSDAARDVAIRADSAFRALYKRSAAIRKPARELLLDAEVPVGMKTLAVRLQQCLPVEDYLELLSAVAEKAEQGDVTAIAAVEKLVLPGADWGTSLTLASGSMQVRELLGTLHGASWAPKMLKKKIDVLLDGSQLRYVQGAAEREERLPRISCK